MATPIYKTADGKLYTEAEYYMYGVNHQVYLMHKAELEGKEAEGVKVSCDHGEHWDYEWNDKGWKRAGEEG